MFETSTYQVHSARMPARYARCVVCGAAFLPPRRRLPTKDRIMTLTPRLLAAAAISLAALSASAAHAQSETFTFSAANFTDNSVGGSEDSFIITGTNRTQTITLTSGMSQTVSIGSAEYFAQDVSNPSMTFNSRTSQNFTLNGTVFTYQQSYVGFTSGVNDNGSAGASSLSLGKLLHTYDLGSMGKVDVQLNAVKLGTVAYGTSTAPHTYSFLLHDVPAAAPEPSSFAALGVGALSIGALLLRARKRTARAA